MNGSFGYDPDLQDTTPLKEENIDALYAALKNQMGNPDSMGDASAGKIKYLWSPLEAGDEDALPEIDQYAANWKEFQKWTGRIVHWEYEEWKAPAKRSA
jgi:hypothetical protein